VRLPARRCRVLPAIGAAFPEAANNRVKVLRQMFTWACSPEYGYAEKNPARDVARLRSANPDGIPAWTEEDAARFSAEGEAVRVTHPMSASSDLLRSAPRVG
jgi:hypothetical protein